MSRKPKKERTTGEITRSFIKHKVYGTVYAIEGDDAGTVLASYIITEATACRHTLAGYELTLDGIDQINREIRDFEIFLPVCSDPGHLLGEIGEQEHACQAARGTMNIAVATAKECKQKYEAEEAKLRSMVREAVNPLPLPLFDTPPPPDPWYADGIGIKRCRVCMLPYPCGVDHTAPPATDAPSDQPSA